MIRKFYLSRQQMELSVPSTLVALHSKTVYHMFGDELKLSTEARCAFVIRERKEYFSFY